MCTAWGGYLATVTSYEEHVLMYSLVAFGTVCWIGINDIENEYTWVWTSGNNSTYRYWAPGQVVGPNGEDCGCIFLDGKWHDCSCHETYIPCYFCSTTGQLKFRIYNKSLLCFS